MLAFKYILLASLIVISTDTIGRSRNKFESPSIAISATTGKSKLQTPRNIDTTENHIPRSGKYFILTYGSNPANPLKLGYFNLNNNEYKYFDLEGKLLGEGNYTYETAEKQIKWQSGPFKSVGWGGEF